MDPSRPCGAVKAPSITRGRFLYGRGAHGREARTDNRPASAAEFHEPSDRLGYPDGTWDDPWRNRAFLSRSGASAADDELGSAAQRGSKHQRGSAVSVADASCRLHHRHCAGLQFLRGRITRCSRPVPLRKARRVRARRVPGNWCNTLNSKPPNESAGLVVTTVAALLLLISSARVLAEEEPVARAPLPPPVKNVPANAGEPQAPTEMPGSASGHSASDSTRPTVRFDRPILQHLQKGPHFGAAPDRGKAAGTKRGPSARSADRSKYGLSRQQDRRAIASRTNQRRDRLLAGPRVGQPSPPPDDPVAQIESLPTPPTRAPPLYYPNYFAGPPAYGYAPSYPFAWGPPGPRELR